jgi:hypothetical protein
MLTILISLLVGLVLVLVGAIFLYRRGALGIDKDAAKKALDAFYDKTKDDIDKMRNKP